MYQLDILTDDRSAYIPHVCGDRETVSRTLADLRMSYRVFGPEAFLGAPGYRIHKADKTRPFKLAHSIKVTREPSFHGISINDQAKAMAAHIIATGQTELYLFPDHASPSAREFRKALSRHLCAGPKVKYSISYVDPADYSPKAIREEIERELCPESIAA